jgi:hypothetical protein
MSPSPPPTSLPHCLENLPNYNKPLEAHGPSYVGGGMTWVSRRFSYETLTLYPHSVYLCYWQELFKINLCGVAKVAFIHWTFQWNIFLLDTYESKKHFKHPSMRMFGDLLEPWIEIQWFSFNFFSNVGNWKSQKKTWFYHFHILISLIGDV